MQTRPLLKLIFLVTLCAACRVALSETVVITPETIVGEWHATETHPERGNIDTVFVINANASFSGSLVINNEPVWQYSGVWKLESNRITWEYLKSNLVLLQEDKAETDEILSVTDNALTYRSSRRGTENILYRVR
jgi:hypothetical protein